ncbi:MAG: M23 family metallopeptidase [Gloeobacteraceae cyanobacterium ES-bin-316]|nr:M23 family metallopeptidase [Ferruginibacter sp.]
MKNRTDGLLIIVQFFFLFAMPCVSKAQVTDDRIHDLKAGRVQPDTSYIYSLPFSPKSKFLLIQAYNSKMSHAGELSLDFKMKPGSKIFAAREGVVESVKENSDQGGLKSEYMNDGNHIIIRHYDGSVAMYWHLQKDGVLINEGDSLQKGKHIGFSGNTGYSAFPHLHFQVQDASGRDVATRFYTKKGVRYLRPGKWYEAG